jgi:YesN/AraC family two-component response regulator
MENPLVKRLYLTDVGYFPKAANHYMERKNGINEYIYLYCMDGEGVVWVENKKYNLKENEAFCIPRKKKHYYYASNKNPWSILWVHFSGEDTQYYPLDECLTIRFTSKTVANHMLFLFETLLRVLECNYTLGNFIYVSHVLSMILAETYTRERNDDLVGNKHVKNIVKYMTQNLELNLTLEDLSEKFGLSKSYINAIFVKYMQHAPIDLFIQMKMKEACRQLKTTDLCVYEIAQMVGYGDQYYFSRIFKKIVGVSPREYRNSDYYY